MWIRNAGSYLHRPQINLQNICPALDHHLGTALPRENHPKRQLMLLNLHFVTSSILRRRWCVRKGAA